MATIKRRTINRKGLTRSANRERKVTRKATVNARQFAVRRSKAQVRRVRAFERPLSDEQVADWFYNGSDNIYADKIFDIASNYCGIKFFAAATPERNIMVKYVQESKGLNFDEAVEEVKSLLGIGDDSPFFKDNSGKYAVYEPGDGEAKLVSESQLEEALFEASLNYDEGFNAYEAMAARYYEENPDLLDEDY